MSEDKKYSFVVVKGVEGPSVYLNDYRIAGTKPWGGGHSEYSFICRYKDIYRAINLHLGEFEQENAELKAKL